MVVGFILGSLIAMIFAIFGTLGIFWLLGISPVIGSPIKHLDGIPHFEDICCGLTLLSILLTLGGILQANHSLVRSIGKR